MLDITIPLIFTCCLFITFSTAERAVLTSYPVRAEEGSNLTLTCTTTEKYIWYINWKRNGDDIFGMGPGTGLASTNIDFERLKDRIIYSIDPGRQYNVTLTSVDLKVDHGSSWTCRVRGEDSNNVVIRVGDLPLATTTITTSTTIATTEASSTSTTLLPTTTSSTTLPTTTTKTEIPNIKTTTQEPESNTLTMSVSKTESTTITELPPLDQKTVGLDSSSTAANSAALSRKSNLTVWGMDVASIAAAAVGATIVLALSGICVYGAVKKRKKRKFNKEVLQQQLYDLNFKSALAARKNFGK